MIIEFLCNCLKDLLCGIISCFSFVPIPTDCIAILGEIVSYGVYVCGSDCLFLFFATISFWLGVKLGIGIVVFIWRLLPFT